MSARAELDENGFAAAGALVAPALADYTRALGAQMLAAQDPEARAALRSLGSLITVFGDPRFAPVIEAFGTAIAGLGYPDLRFSAGYFISKPAHSPASFWHQDWGFWGDPRSYQAPTPQIGVLWYLVDVDLENGCPRFLPGSHRRRHPLHALLAATDVASLRRGDDLALAAYQHPPEAVSVPVAADEVVLFDPRVLHGAHANRSDHERPAMAMWFYTGFSELSRGIRAFAASGDPTLAWPPEARASIERWMPQHPGGDEKAELLKYPDARLV
jgi:hypothetical protein